MPEYLQKNLFSTATGTARINRFFLLFLFSAATLAANNGITHLPETYRTPLSDMVYDEHHDWRVEPGEKNPWREMEEDLLIKPRIKVELFPEYTPDSSGNPVSNSLFQNEYEVEKPATSIFKYTF